MSIKGFPSSQKLPLGTGITNEFITVQPIDQYKYGLDITKNAFRVGSDTVPRTAAANTGNIEGMTWIYDTANPAKKGDFVRFETGSNAGLEVAIVKVEINRFLLGALLNSAPVAGDTYYIMRYSTQRVNTDGTSIVAISPAPIEFVRTGVNTQVNWDENDSNNTTPLPIRQFDAAGNIFDTDIYTSISDAVNNTWTILSNAQGQQLPASSFSVVTATGHVVPVSATALPLPTGAATSAAQTDGTQKTQITDGAGATVGVANLSTALAGGNKAIIASAVVHGKSGGNYYDWAVDSAGIGSVSVTNFPATQTVSGSVSVSNFPATQPVSGTVAVSNTFALDTTLTTTNTEIGSLTETAPATDTASSGLNGRLQRIAQRLTSLIALFPTSIGQKANAGSLSVALASDTTIPAALGRVKVAQLFNDYSVTSVTTGAYVQLTASTAATVNKIEIFDSSGEALILAVGGAGSEVDQLYIFPGGNGPVDLAIPASSRISVKAKTNTASSGFLAVNLYS